MHYAFKTCKLSAEKDSIMSRVERFQLPCHCSCVLQLANVIHAFKNCKPSAKIVTMIGDDFWDLHSYRLKKFSISSVLHASSALSTVASKTSAGCLLAVFGFFVSECS